MRMNRGTILLLLVSLVVIVAVLVLTINQATAPGTTATDTGEAEATPEVLFPIVNAESVVRLEVRDDLSGDRLVLVKSGEGDEWAIESAEPVEGEIDQAQAGGLLASLLAMQGQESFEADDLTQYGLSQPSYSVYAVAEDGAVHAMHIGNQNPAGTRFYTVVEQLAPGTTRPDLELLQPLLERAEVQTSLSDEDSPVAEQGIPTLSAQFAADPTLAALAEAMQEEDDEEAREELAATFSAMIDATNVAGGMGTAGNVPGGVAVDSTAEATAADGETGEMTEVAEAGAEATDMQPLLERDEVDTSETTLEPQVVDAAGATTTPAVTEEATADATAEPVREPLVTLEGPQTVYLVNVQPLRALIAAISQPPVAIPLEGPTETPPPLIPEELTDEAPGADAVDATAEVEVTTAP